MEFVDFIVKAKKSTYASGKKSDIIDGFETLTYEEGEFSYRDKWKGHNPFGGQEVIRGNGEIIWVMNYYGKANAHIEKVFAFLRKSLRNVTTDMPFRGPHMFKEGDFEYKNEFEGDINKFKGTEEILFQGEEVYKLEYHGGIV
jgi:hypothetical protein